MLCGVDHVLTSWPKNSTRDDSTWHDLNRAVDVETTHAYAVTERMLTRLSAEKAWSPKIGGKWPSAVTCMEWNA